MKAFSALFAIIEPEVLELFPNAKTGRELYSSIESYYMDEMGKPEELLIEFAGTQLTHFGTIEEYVQTRVKQFAILTFLGMDVTEEQQRGFILGGLNDEDFYLLKQVAKKMELKDLLNLLKKHPWKNPKGDATVASVTTTPRESRTFEHRPLHCWVCGKPGHLAHHCFHRKGPDRTQSNKEPSKYLCWVADSGATFSMITESYPLMGYKKVYGKMVKTASGEFLPIIGEGRIALKQRRGPKLTIQVKHVPGLKFNLLSVSDIDNLGGRVLFDRGACHVMKGDKLILKGCKRASEPGIYTIVTDDHPPGFERTIEEHAGRNSKSLIAIVDENNNPDKSSLMELHERLGHINVDQIRKLVRARLITGVDIDDDSVIDCASCLKGKLSRKRHAKRASRQPQRLGEIVSADLIGPFPVEGLYGERYISQIIDHYSSWTSVKCLKDKTAESVLAHAQEFFSFLEAQNKGKIKIFRTDNGSEYCNAKMESFLKGKGAVHEKTSPYNPKDNGKVERRNRTLSQTFRTMIKGSNLSSRLWAEAAKTAGFLINRTITSSVPGLTPFEVVYGYPPNLKGVQKFGKKCYVFNENPKDKLSDRAYKGILVGFSNGTELYRVLVQRNKIVESRNVRFVESGEDFELEITTDKDVIEIDSLSKVPQRLGAISFPSPAIENLDVRNTQQEQEENQVETLENQSSQDEESGEEQQDKSSQSETENEYEEEEDDFQDALSETGEDVHDGRMEIPELELKDTSSEQVKKVENQSTEPTPTDLQSIFLEESAQSSRESLDAPRRSTRATRFQGSFAPVKRSNKELSVISHARTETSESVEEHETDVTVSDDIATCVIGESSNPSVQVALNSNDKHEWEEAIEKEVRSLESNNTWTVTTLPKGRKAVGSRFVLTRKLAAGTHKLQHKARLVAQGFSQIKGVDYFDTFSPVTRNTSVFVLLTLAAHFKYDIHHMDFNSAYLNAKLSEEIYMRPPKGFPRAMRDDEVLRLNKSLYGLKQSGREWYLLISSSLRRLGWKENKKDPCFFSRKAYGQREHLLLYVDDLMIVSPNSQRSEFIKAEVSSLFSVKDLGEISYFLGMKIERSEDKSIIYLSQNDLIDNMITKHDLETRRPVTTAPIVQQSIISPRSTEDGVASPDFVTRYRFLVGTLLYISRYTRPDISYAVNVCTRFQQNPAAHHMELVERIALYLRTTSDYRLILNGNETLKLKAFSDADWAGCKVTSASTSGYIILLGNSPISWSSSRQDCISLSTMESEYVSMSDCSREIILIHTLLKQAGYKLKIPELKCDNQSAIKLTINDCEHRGSRHINLRYHFIKQIVAKGRLHLTYVSSQENLADGFTKVLPVASFKRWILKLCDWKPSPNRGAVELHKS